MSFVRQLNPHHSYQVGSEKGKAFGKKRSNAIHPSKTRSSF